MAMYRMYGMPRTQEQLFGDVQGNHSAGGGIRAAGAKAVDVVLPNPNSLFFTLLFYLVWFCDVLML